MSGCEVFYTFDSTKWHLWSLCKREHRWPGTNNSLRSNYVDKKGNKTTTCAGCAGSAGWLKNFIDHNLTKTPAGFKLGKLCPKNHGYMGTEYSLRSVKRGACNLCDKHRIKTAAQKASSRAWYAKNREHVKAKAKANKQLRVATGQWEAYRLQNKVRHAAYNRQWRRNKGVDTRADYLEKRRLDRALRRSTYMSVAALVAQQYAIYTKEHCNKDEEATRKRRNALWRRKYSLNADLRMYNRNKAKARKAALRKNTVLPVSTAELKHRFMEFNNTCAYCGAGNTLLHIEHVVPISKGGSHSLNNVVPACSRCNYSKYNHEVRTWYTAQPYFSQNRLDRVLSTINAQPTGAQCH